MERCPLCKARLRAKTTCNRCEADLSLLQAIESEADQQAMRAIHSLLAGENQTASRQATAARDLHATTFHHALSGFIEILAGDKDVIHTSALSIHTEQNIIG